AGPRGRVFVRRQEPLGRDVRVALGGGEGGVAQELLDAAQVGAHVEQVRGEAVAERVRMDVAAGAGDQGVLVEVAGDAAGREVRAAAVDEERRSGRTELSTAGEPGV